MSRQFQLRPHLRTSVPNAPAPSLQRGNPYQQEARSLVMHLHDNDYLNDPQYRDLWNEMRNAGVFPHPKTIGRWENREEEEGNILPYRRTGNRFATVLRDESLIDLAFFRAVYPRATIAETNAFLYHAGGRQRFYSNSQISSAETLLLGMTRKRSSTTARQAFTPRVLQLRHNYWNLSYPNGIADIRRVDFIDLDEAAVFVETANRAYGKSVTIVRIRDEGPYGHSQKLTLLQAITGEDSANGQPTDRWTSTWETGGTTVVRMIDFIREILDDIGDGNMPGARRRCFIMDNLTSHENPIIAQMIMNAGHRIAFRAPYWPVDGPIEYVFNTEQQALTLAMYRIMDINDLRRELNAIVASITDFANYFINCGYTLV